MRMFGIQPHLWLALRAVPSEASVNHSAGLAIPLPRDKVEAAISGTPIAGWFTVENHGKSIYRWIFIYRWILLRVPSWIGNPPYGGFPKWWGPQTIQVYRPFEYWDPMVFRDLPFWETSLCCRRAFLANYLLGRLFHNVFPKSISDALGSRLVYFHGRGARQKSRTSKGGRKEGRKGRKKGRKEERKELRRKERDGNAGRMWMGCEACK